MRNIRDILALAGPSVRDGSRGGEARPRFEVRRHSPARRKRQCYLENIVVGKSDERSGDRDFEWKSRRHLA